MPAGVRTCVLYAARHLRVARRGQLAGLVLRELLAEGGEEASELLDGDHAVAVLVEVLWQEIDEEEMVNRSEYWGSSKPLSQETRVGNVCVSRVTLLYEVKSKASVTRSAVRGRDHYAARHPDLSRCQDQMNKDRVTCLDSSRHSFVRLLAVLIRSQIGNFEPVKTT